MIGSGKKEGWPECFQDLGGWCPLPQDELHTPKVNLQDEFNFSIDDGHANDWDLLSSPVESDPWGNDSPFGISSYQSAIGELNSSFIQEGTPQRVSNKTPNLLGSGGKLLYTITTEGSKSPLKYKGNVLLSQGIVKSTSDDSTYFNMAATLENQSNNSVLITNDCYLLPITVPEFASAKLNSSSLSTSYTPPPPLQPSTPPPTKKVGSEVTTVFDALSQNKQTENIRIKEEEQGLDDSFKVPAVCSDGANIDMEQPPPDYRRGKPELKLNIAAANNAAKFTSTLNTPEVLRRLVDGDNKEFNLLQYVCNDGEFPGLSQEAVSEDGTVGEIVAVRDHDYIDPWSSSEIKTDVVVKTEPGSPSSTSCSLSNRSTDTGRMRRKRQRDDSSDYIATDSDESASEEDSQQEWSPTPAKRRTKRKSSVNSKTSGKIGTGGKRTVGGIRRNQGNSQAQPVNTGQDKYRALRERNNEASRRSRMNRKQRDEEMLQKSDELHKRNVYLKARAEKMESLVKLMRAEIMKALKKSK